MGRDDLEVRTDVGSCQRVLALEGEDVVIVAAVHDRATPADVDAALEVLQEELPSVARDPPSAQAAVTDGGES